MQNIDKITEAIGNCFRSFGGGQGGTNIMAQALKDEPFQFAAGVDIKAVVTAVLKLSEYDTLLKACKDALEFFVEWDVQNKVISGLSIQLRAAIAEAEKQS